MMHVVEKEVNLSLVTQAGHCWSVHNAKAMQSHLSHLFPSHAALPVWDVCAQRT